MSAFEFLAVLISIIIGLGVTHLLSGIGRQIHHRKASPPDLVHSFWVVNAFLILVLNWWVFFSWQSNTAWNFSEFLAILVWAVLLYMMCVLVYPPDLEHWEQFEDVWETNRRWFLGVFVGMGVMDIVQTWLRGALLEPPGYLPFVLHYVALALAAIFVRNRVFQATVAAWVFVSLLVWSVLIRGLLSSVAPGFG